MTCWSLRQRQTGISVSYRKHRYQGLWYQYRSRLGHFLGLGISIGIGRDTCTSFLVICNNSLLSKVSVSVSVPGHFPGISISIGLDSDQFQVLVSVSVSIEAVFESRYQSRYRSRGLCIFCMVLAEFLLSKVSVSVSVPVHFPGISISIGLDSDQL